MSRQPFNTRWAEGVETQNSSTVFQTPDNTRISSGWEGGADKDAPPAGQENWWHNRVDSALQDLERYGVMTWVNGAVYAGGAPVKASDGNYYESINSNNTGNDPVATSGYWRLLGPSLYSIVPVASLIAVAHSGVPDTGWLKCNGAVLARATYPRLFEKIGTTYNTSGESSLQFRLPDLRGEFLRGFDDNRGIDSGRVFGSAQGDAIRNITGSFSMSGGGFYDGASGAMSLSTTTSGTRAGSLTNVNQTDDILFNASSVVPTAGENRPRNRAFNFWIKY